MLTKLSEDIINYDSSGRKYKTATYLCNNCGNNTVKRVYDVSSGKTTSCGCIRRETARKLNSSHKMTNSREYRCWRNMIGRCTDEKVANYPDYGGRGIKVCDRWLLSCGGSFENFFEDMGHCQPGLSIDRIDVNGHYEPGNCRWADVHTQALNRRDIKRDLPRGVSMTISNTYRAYLNVEGIQKHLGTYKTMGAALKARQAAELKFLGYMLREPYEAYNIEETFKRLGVEYE